MLEYHHHSNRTIQSHTEPNQHMGRYSSCSLSPDPLQVPLNPCVINAWSLCSPLPECPTFAAKASIGMTKISPNITGSCRPETSFGPIGLPAAALKLSKTTRLHIAGPVVLSTSSSLGSSSARLLCCRSANA